MQAGLLVWLNTLAGVCNKAGLLAPPSPAVGIGSAVQQELHHLLMASTGAVEEGCPAMEVLHLQLGTLLQKKEQSGGYGLLLPPTTQLKTVGDLDKPGYAVHHVLMFT